MSWTVVLTKPNQEGIAELNLARQGYTSYCPRYQQVIPNKTPVTRPLFPRYMFVFIDQFWSSLMGTRGISRVLLNGNGPVYLPTSEIDKLREREIKGLVQLTPPPKFHPGQKVKCGEGPLTGHLVIYEGMTGRDRVRVLADLLGRKCLIELDEKTLVAA